MAVPCVAAADVGTTAVKVCLFSRELRLLRCSSREYALDIRPGGIVEADPDVYRSALREGFAEVLAGGEYDVLALGMTTQGETMVAADHTGKPLMNCMVWLDSRAGRQAESLRQVLDEQEFYETTGLPGIDGALPLAKLKMLREEHPEIMKNTRCILLLEDLLLHWMTGRFVSERSLQTSTGWFSLKTDDYWDRALQAAGVDRSILPELAEPGEIVGTLLRETAEELGLPAGIPVVAGAMDQTAAALAMGCDRPGRICETTGTALTAAAATSSPVFSEKHRVTVYRHAVRGRFIYLAIGNTGGRALTWARDALCPGMSYDEMTRAAEGVPAGSGGVVFLPFLNGLVDPDNRPEAKGCFYGMTLETDMPHLIRGVMEGVACQLKDLLDMMRELGCGADEVISLGGGASSALWEQIKADLCGIRFVVPDSAEAAARGAALLVLRGTGLMEGEGTPAIVRSYGPDPENAEASRICAERYRRLYRALLPVFGNDDMP
ncbi:MAG: FGGY family carbohydrate kinase [Clostridia bacterium]|nr:FGGY family carbohydrate kinase [Clostridia bacterium]